MDQSKAQYNELRMMAVNLAVNSLHKRPEAESHEFIELARDFYQFLSETDPMIDVVMEPTDNVFDIRTGQPIGKPFDDPSQIPMNDPENPFGDVDEEIMYDMRERNTPKDE